VLKDDVRSKDLSRAYYKGAVSIVDDLIGKAGRRLGVWINALAAESKGASVERREFVGIRGRAASACLDMLVIRWERFSQPTILSLRDWGLRSRYVIERLDGRRYRHHVSDIGVGFHA
jgi:hypothetical protein